MAESWGAIATIWALGVGSIAATIFWPRDSDGRRRRWLEREPASPIRDATVGSVIKIVGKVEAVEPLIEAPLSGRSALAFVARVDKLYTVERGRQGAAFYRGEKRAQDFLIRDETGVALVRVAGADIIAEPRDAILRDSRATRWLRGRGGSSRFLGLIERNLRFSETALVPGAEAVVLGQCAERSVVGTDGPYRDAGEPLITIEASRRGSLVLCWSRAPAINVMEPLFKP